MVQGLVGWHTVEGYSGSGNTSLWADWSTSGSDGFVSGTLITMLDGRVNGSNNLQGQPYVQGDADASVSFITTGASTVFYVLKGPSGLPNTQQWLSALELLPEAASVSVYTTWAVFTEQPTVGMRRWQGIDIGLTDSTNAQGICLNCESSRPWQGSAIMIFDRLLSSADIMRTEAYLASVFGITLLRLNASTAEASPSVILLDQSNSSTRTTNATPALPTSLAGEHESRPRSPSSGAHV